MHPVLQVNIVGQTSNLNPYYMSYIETKCVSEFDILNVLGEKNSTVNVCAYNISSTAQK